MPDLEVAKNRWAKRYTLSVEINTASDDFARAQALVANRQVISAIPHGWFVAGHLVTNGTCTCGQTDCVHILAVMLTHARRSKVTQDWQTLDASIARHPAGKHASTPQQGCNRWQEAEAAVERAFDEVALPPIIA